MYNIFIRNINKEFKIWLLLFVNVSADEVTEGTLGISSTGTFDVTNYKYVKVSREAVSSKVTQSQAITIGMWNQEWSYITIDYTNLFSEIESVEISFISATQSSFYGLNRETTQIIGTTVKVGALWASGDRHTDYVTATYNLSVTGWT